MKPQHLCQFSANNTNNRVPESRSLPPEAAQWQFSSIVFLTGCAGAREKKEVSLWGGVNDMLKAFQMEERLGMCHCKQVW